MSRALLADHRNGTVVAGDGAAAAAAVYVFVHTLQEVFSGRPLAAVEQLRQTDVIPPALLSDYQKLLSSQTVRRLNPSKV